MRPLFFFLLVLAIARCACAQQASSSPTAPASHPAALPSGQLLKPVADNTRWTITTTVQAAETPKPTETPKPAGKSRSGKGADRTKSPKPSETSKAANAATATITGEKAGKQVHILSVTANGAKTEKWSDGKLTATLVAGAREPIFATDSIEAVPMPTWVSRKNYVETRREDTKIRFFFRDRIIPTTVEQFRDYENPESADPEKLKIEATALIDADTGLPLIVTEGTTVTAYKFEPLEPDVEIIPPAIRSALEEREQKMQDVARPPVRP